MMALLPGFEYDIFISYRQKDNRSDQWVTHFVDALKAELDATFKEDISIYFDENSHDGLLETHDVDDSLKDKLKCLIFIPIISQTYCDPKSFAWNHEFLAFKKLANADHLGLKIKLASGNVASRILPVRIHDLDAEDRTTIENELGPLRPIDFIYKEPGVNRPLKPADSKSDNQNSTEYVNQVNKVANAIREIVAGIRRKPGEDNRNEVDASSEETESSFMDRLVQNNVLKATFVYLLLSATLWKLGELSITLFHLPARLLQFIIAILVILFPIAVILAWVYERSPQGFVRTGSQAAIGNSYSENQKKPFTSNLFILLLAATLALLFILFPQPPNNKASPPAEVDRSIAVLPFVDLSPNHDQEYFSDGMMEEILNNLYKVGDLKVVSRTTSMSYKGSKKSMGEIGRELHVANVLEGSVRKDGNRVRITVQLIDPATDEHRWSENYDREMSDVFAIQSEVAQKIAGYLNAEMSPEVKRSMEFPMTKNMEALDLFLRARSMEGESPEEAEEMLTRVIKMDSTFAPAYAELGSAWINKGIFNGRMHAEEVVAHARPLINKALKLNNDYPPAHVYLSGLNLLFEWNFSGAMQELEIINQLNPSFSDEKQIGLLVILGHSGEALKRAQEGYLIDSAGFRGVLPLCLYFTGRRTEALEMLKAQLKAGVNETAYSFNMGRLCLWFGMYGEAQRVSKTWLTKDPKSRLPVAISYLAMASFHLRAQDQTQSLLNELAQKSKESPVGSPSYYSSLVYTQMNDVEHAFQWLDKAYHDHEVEMIWLKVEPLFDPLRSDPRWQQLLDRVGFARL